MRRLALVSYRRTRDPLEHDDVRGFESELVVKGLRAGVVAEDVQPDRRQAARLRLALEGSEDRRTVTLALLLSDKVFLTNV